MSAEFTGERVIPGQVDIDLWNEHAARYAFASQFAEGRTVLDAGCGTGYGSEELARSAKEVVAVDVALDAIDYARANHAQPNIRYVQASCSAPPFAPRTFDLVVAFEVIEHLGDWADLIRSSCELLASGGCFLVSTPNKRAYAEMRRDSGPNPFHVHEFTYEEFRGALEQVFPVVTIYLQDHVEGVAFRTPHSSATAKARLDAGSDLTETSSFFVALCSMQPTAEPAPFVYVPRSANILSERAAHIDLLTQEVAQKGDWLAKAQADHQALLALFNQQSADLTSSNEWAANLNTKLTSAGTRIVDLQRELEQQKQAALETAAQYESHLKEKQRTEELLTAQLQEIATDRDRQVEQLTKAVELLHQSEALIEERTNWALGLEAEKRELEKVLRDVRDSRWIRLGRSIKLGPELER